METAEHILVLRGPAVAGGRPHPEALGRVLRLVEPTVRDAVSMAFRNSSRISGRRPQWLQDASDIRVTGISKGRQESTQLHFAAPRLGSAAGALYRQGQLFDTRPERNDTGFDILGDVLRDIGKEARDSVRFDSGLLRRVERFSRLVCGDDVASISVLGNRLPREHPPTLDARICALATMLDSQTPAPARARVAGRLDMIRASDRVFELIFLDGTKVRGVWTGPQMASLTEWFEKDVVVEGQAVFRVSGKLLRIDVQAIDTATQADEFFRKVPKPTSEALVPTSLRQAQTRSTGAGAIYGKWPGDETEEEFDAALKELS